MVFLRETINEQEALLRRAAGDGRNDASAAVLSASISARVKALTEHLKVCISYVPQLYYILYFNDKKISFDIDLYAIFNVINNNTVSTCILGNTNNTLVNFRPGSAYVL